MTGKVKTSVLGFLILCFLASCYSKKPAKNGLSGVEDTIENVKGLKIGFSVTPPPHLLKTEEDITREFERIKDAGMTMVKGFWSYDSITFDAVLNECERLGLGYILPLRMNKTGKNDFDEELNRFLAEVEKYMNHPAIAAFYIVDEPPAQLFDRLATVRESIDAVIPKGKYSYANLYPSYATAEQLGMEDFKTYVDRYMSKVKPQVLSFDHYPFKRNPADDNYRRYIDDLLLMRSASLEYGVPWEGFIQCVGWNGTREPTYTEMRWQNNMHILFGAKGYSWFLYAMPYEDGGSEKFTTSALDWNGNLHRSMT